MNDDIIKFDQKSIYLGPEIALLGADVAGQLAKKAVGLRITSEARIVDGEIVFETELVADTGAKEIEQYDLLVRSSANHQILGLLNQMAASIVQREKTRFSGKMETAHLHSHVEVDDTLEQGVIKNADVHLCYEDRYVFLQVSEMRNGEQRTITSLHASINDQIASFILSEIDRFKAWERDARNTLEALRESAPTMTL